MLNEKQHKLLEFIFNYTKAHGSAPTVREMREELEYGPEWQLNILLARGYLSKKISKSKGIEITDLGRKQLLNKPVGVNDNGQAL